MNRQQHYSTIITWMSCMIVVQTPNTSLVLITKLYMDVLVLPQICIICILYTYCVYLCYLTHAYTCMCSHTHTHTFQWQISVSVLLSQVTWSTLSTEASTRKQPGSSGAVMCLQGFDHFLSCVFSSLNEDPSPSGLSPSANSCVRGCAATTGPFDAFLHINNS